jgi:uncharacterized YccA/Bax inhibitor family protein
MSMNLKTSNPVFAGSTYTVNGVGVGYGPTMTISGTVNKTGTLMLCVLATALWTWNQFFTNGPTAIGGYVAVGAIGGLVVALVTVFKREWSPITAPVYALLEGLFLGALSAMFESRYHGIAIEAVALTFGTCFAMLLAYRAGVIKPTQRLMGGIVAATGGIAIVYFASMILGMFHIQIPGIFGNGPVGILFSLVVVTIAALNLILDFAVIEDGARRGSPKYMEWYSAFGLIVTLVWLYLEMIRLLSKLREQR